MNNLQIIVFRLGHESYGLMAHEVKEIARRKELFINKVPKVPKNIVGILNLRGDVVPITDLRIRLGADSKTTSKQERVMIVHHDQHLFGLVVDEMLGVRSVTEQEFSLPPEDLAAEEPYISSLLRQDQKVIFMLDMGYLFTQGEDLE